MALNSRTLNKLISIFFAMERDSYESLSFFANAISAINKLLSNDKVELIIVLEKISFEKMR